MGVNCILQLANQQRFSRMVISEMSTNFGFQSTQKRPLSATLKKWVHTLMQRFVQITYMYLVEALL
jgi:hypothetical protein